VKKLYFIRGENLFIFIVNQETGEKQDFGLNISEKWPEGLLGLMNIEKREIYEITPYLESIGVL
jgi:hypothetical protein